MTSDPIADRPVIPAEYGAPKHRAWTAFPKGVTRFRFADAS